MKVLVTAASKHGATTEIAQAIAEVLAGQGIDAPMLAPADVRDVDDYDAAIVGSAVYAGQWLGSAKEMVSRCAKGLSERPVWLFSSGPIGDPPKPAEDPVDAAEMVAATRAREHRVFGGRLDRSRLGFAEKAIVVALRAPNGDFRDWDAIRAWAAGIAESLRARPG